MHNQPEEALYLVAVRTKIEPSGKKHHETMQAIKQVLGTSIPLKSDDTTVGATVTLYTALTPNHNGYLREFGFDFNTANRLITIGVAPYSGMEDSDA